MPTSHPALAPLTLPAGLRATRAVQALLSLLPDQPAQGWTEGAVEAALHQQGVAVNRVTVYRALDRFCAAGLLQRSVDGQRVTRYWLAAPVAHDHAAPHMECSGCHQPFQLGEGSAAVQAALQALRQALAHSGVRNPTLDVAVQGECAQCAAETSPPVSSPPSGNSP